MFEKFASFTDNTGKGKNRDCLLDRTFFFQKRCDCPDIRVRPLQVLQSSVDLYSYFVSSF